MTSDRPYRVGLSVDEALAEIERNIGTQFHPTVAKAFVAQQRGQDPLSALDGGGARGDQRRLDSLPRPGHPRRSTPARTAEVRCTGRRDRGARRCRPGPALARRRGRRRGSPGLHAPGLDAVPGQPARARTGRSRSPPGDRPRCLRRRSNASCGRRRGATGSRSSSGRRTGSGARSSSCTATAHPAIALMSWLVREAESRDDLLVTGGARARRRGGVRRSPSSP